MKLATRFGVLLAGLALVVSACAPAPAASPTPAPGTATPAPTPVAKKVKIYSSLPLTGPSRTQTVQIVNTIKQALDEINSKVGNITIEYEALDDATAAKQSWDAAQEAENARKAIADKSAVIYIGTFNSGAAKVSIPLLCAANMAMISPANTYPGLTKGPERGAAPDEPGKYYPGCKRNYSRVVPADDIQGAVGANWMKELGVKKVYILHDTELYGKGIADVFRTKAKEIGLAEAGYEGAPKADNYRSLANKIKDSGADGVYYGGIVDNNPAVLLKDLRAVSKDLIFVGPDGINCSEFLKGAGPSAEGGKTYSTVAGTPAEKYTGKALAWLTAYKAKFGGGNPDPYAIYGYEAGQVAIAAIRKAGDKADDRVTIRDIVMGTKDFEGVLGKWSYDAGGDTTLTTMAGYIAEKGEWKFVKEIK